MSEIRYSEGKKRIKSAIWILFWIAFAQTVATFIFGVIISFLPYKIHTYVQMTVIELAAFLIPVFIYANLGSRKISMQIARSEFKLCGFKPYLIPLIILVGAGCQFVSVIINMPFLYIFQPSGQAFLPTTVWEFLAGIVVVCIIPAILEEFLFRGMVYGAMEKYSPKAAIIYTSVMFMFMHFSISGAPGYLLLAIVAVFVLRRTGSLYAAVLLHFCNNLTALILEFSNEALIDMPMLTIALFLIGAAVFFGSIFVMMGITKKVKQEERAKCSVILGQSFISVPTFLCVLSLIVFALFGSAQI